ncbi:predicted protein [Naegleria gruberi]|uniref:Predicted protein n=1 Tax=Naegleria gruberi TaxID=5762 RepID=D2UXF5_NAEGR|nr:uncharacterized protein NAEGRDRAFT_61105 [Naegleria gruberi]EFC50624.1 predicted protein [Naegleria gruberi]|eukprot:XP_002683368.1 predicted protein [Naegleria gruberi strain NEG-M]
MDSEENRLASFFNRQDGLSWPHTDESHPYCTPKLLAANGFYFFPTSTVRDMCQCHYCGIRLRDWEPTDNVHSEHKKHKPDCPFLLENDDQDLGFDLFGDESNTHTLQPNATSQHNSSIIDKASSIISDEMKLRGQFASDLLFSLINPQNDWNFEMDLDSPKTFNIPQIK